MNINEPIDYDERVGTFKLIQGEGRPSWFATICGPAIDDEEETARRLVACWNAFLGVPTDEIGRAAASLGERGKT